jgi:hypothetical protein
VEYISITVCQLMQTLSLVSLVSSHFKLKLINLRFYYCLLINESALLENDAVPVTAYALALPSA